ncbi:MAG: hypothetical protein WD396_06290, partial [Pseudohongiellaceae bacterium]
ASSRLGESKKKLIREKSTPKMCSATVIFPVHHTLGTLSERNIYPQILRRSPFFAQLIGV